MKKILIAFACTLPFGMAVADEAPLLDTTESSTLVQLNETELDAVRGGQKRYGKYLPFTFIANNTAVVTQLNLSLGSFGVFQSNYAKVNQRNR